MSLGGCGSPKRTWQTPPKSIRCAVWSRDAVRVWGNVIDGDTATENHIMCAVVLVRSCYIHPAPGLLIRRAWSIYLDEPRSGWRCSPGHSCPPPETWCPWWRRECRACIRWSSPTGQSKASLKTRQTNRRDEWHLPSTPWSRKRRRSRRWRGRRRAWSNSPSETWHSLGWWRTGSTTTAKRSAI